MKNRARYGQYCPLSMASEILCNRWTTLLLRELLEGSETFNEIHRGVPMMSRTLLSQRLKELAAAGLVTRTEQGPGRAVFYRLTKAGEALGPVIFGIATWGQEWIDTEPSLADADTDFLMWDIRRNVRFLPVLPSPFVVEFFLPDAPEAKAYHWLVFDRGVVDLCYIDPGYEVDVFIEVNQRDLIQVWMGWTALEDALASDTMKVSGPSKYTDCIREWLGLSSLAHIKKQPPEHRVLRAKV